MRNKYELLWHYVLIATVAILIALLIRVNVLNNQLRAQNADLKYHVEQIIEDYLEAYIDMMGDAYDVEVERAVLEERVYWLEKQVQDGVYTRAYVQQFYDDMDTFLDFMQHDVVITNDWGTSVENFIINYPMVYWRIDNIYDENH